MRKGLLVVAAVATALAIPASAQAGWIDAGPFAGANEAFSPLTEAGGDVGLLITEPGPPSAAALTSAAYRTVPPSGRPGPLVTIAAPPQSGRIVSPGQTYGVSADVLLGHGSTIAALVDDPNSSQNTAAYS